MSNESDQKQPLGKHQKIGMFLAGGILVLIAIGLLVSYGVVGYNQEQPSTEIQSQ